MIRTMSPLGLYVDGPVQKAENNKYGNPTIKYFVNKYAWLRIV